MVWTMESKIEQAFLASKNNYNPAGQDENVLIVSSIYIYIYIYHYLIFILYIFFIFWAYLKVCIVNL